MKLKRALILLSVCFMQFAFAQQKTITGTVTDEEETPLPGVNITLEGTSKGTSTDFDGKYEIKVEEGQKLKFSAVGFEEQSMKVGEDETINLILSRSAEALEEAIINIGYGTQTEENITSSIDVISGEALENRSAHTMDELLKGTSPNLNITMSGLRGGEPGSESSLNIRGLGSISGNSEPLVLVDGVEFKLNDVDPATVKDVSVLKDASASAIYGSRAAHGVILITTKEGSKDQKTKIDYSTNLIISSPIRVPHFVDSYTWATAYNQAADNAGQASVYAEEQMDRIRGYLDGTFTDEYDPENPIDGIWSGRRDGNANYDWPHELIADNSFSQRHNISVSGGNEKTQYFVSGSYDKENGIYAHGYDYSTRQNLTSNLTTNITDWLSVSPRMKFVKNYANRPLGETTVGREHQFREYLMFAPMMPYYNTNGTIQSPMVRQQQGTGRDKDRTNNLLLSMQAELEPIDGWVTRLSYNYNYIGGRHSTNPKPIDVEVGTGEIGNIGKPNTQYTSKFSERTNELANITSSYDFNINNDHNATILSGYEQEYNYSTSLMGDGTDLVTDQIPSLSTTLGKKNVDDAISHWATQGFFGRINYDYKEKYLIEFSARYDGSSRFEKDSRWGFFPSGAFSYRISDEEFWGPIKSIVNNLKFRVSYGSLGNQNVNNYLYLSNIPISKETPWIIDDERPGYAGAPNLISNNLTWETVSTFNLGMDARFFGDRLRLNFDWYRKNTTDMIGPSVTLPYTLGASAPQENNAEMETKGFEFVVSWEDNLNEDFSYNAKLSIGDNRSKILKYTNEKQLIDNWYEGKRVGEIWGYKTDGLIQKSGENMPDQSKFYNYWGPGDMKYKDLNDDGVVDDGNRTVDNHGDLTIIGNSSPRYQISISAGFNWKNFDFNMFWQGVGKRDYLPKSDGENPIFYGLSHAETGSSVLKEAPVLDYWRPEDETNDLGPNTDAYFAKPYFSNETYKNRQPQSRYVLNAAYLRLKSLQLGYSLPESLLGKSFIDRFRIFVQGENLLTITDLPKSYDPETSIASNPENGGYTTDGVIYPISRTLSLGVNLSF